jgi:hypothetical protein
MRARDVAEYRMDSATMRAQKPANFCKVPGRNTFRRKTLSGFANV